MGVPINKGKMTKRHSMLERFLADLLLVS